MTVTFPKGKQKTTKRRWMRMKLVVKEWKMLSISERLRILRQEIVINRQKFGVEKMTKL